MNPLEFLRLLNKRKQTLISVTVVCLAVAMLLVVFQPFKYEASSRLLVSQEFTPGTDAYTISQSNNYLSKLLARVVGSQSFYNEVVSSGFQINKDYFRKGTDQEKEMEEWNKTVVAGSPNAGNGIMEVQVLHPDRQQAEQLAQGVNYVLQTKNREYHGLGDNMFLKVIDGPIVSERPVEPNIFVIFPFTIVLALFLASLYIYYFPEDKYDLKIIPKNNTPSSKKKGGIGATTGDKDLVRDLGKRIRKEKRTRPGKQDLPWEDSGENFEPLDPYLSDPGQKQNREESKEEIEKRGDMRNIFG
jgi:capsular polysaccharide biosynthesis protein